MVEEKKEGGIIREEVVEIWLSAKNYCKKQMLCPTATNKQTNKQKWLNVSSS